MLENKKLLPIFIKISLYLLYGFFFSYLTLFVFPFFSPGKLPVMQIIGTVSLAMIWCAVYYNFKGIKERSKCRFYNGVGFLLLGAMLIFFLIFSELYARRVTSYYFTYFIYVIYGLCVGVFGALSLYLGLLKRDYRFLKGSVFLLIVSLLWIILLINSML